MSPICEELIIDDMETDVKRKEICNVPFILQLRVIRICYLDKSHQWGLTEDVNQRPLYIKSLLFLIL